MKKIGSLPILLAVVFFLSLFSLVLYFLMKTQFSQGKKQEKTATVTSSPSSPKPPQTLARSVTITNSITDTMLTYKHWSGAYKPTIFVITINGNRVEMHESIKTNATPDNTIIIRYDYSFAHGYKTGCREIEFALSNHQDTYQLTFSWFQNGHLILENGMMIRATVLPFNKQLEHK